jgi:hypothetical protein
MKFPDLVCRSFYHDIYVSEYNFRQCLLYSIAKQKSPVFRQDFFVNKHELHAGKAGVDFAEYIADDRSEDHEGRDNDDGYQNEN